MNIGSKVWGDTMKSLNHIIVLLVFVLSACGQPQQDADFPGKNKKLDQVETQQLRDLFGAVGDVSYFLDSLQIQNFDQSTQSLVAASRRVHRRRLSRSVSKAQCKSHIKGNSKIFSIKLRGTDCPVKGAFEQESIEEIGQSGFSLKTKTYAKRFKTFSRRVRTEIKTLSVAGTYKVDRYFEDGKRVRAKTFRSTITGESRALGSFNYKVDETLTIVRQRQGVQGRVRTYERMDRMQVANGVQATLVRQFTERNGQTQIEFYSLNNKEIEADEYFSTLQDVNNQIGLAHSGAKLNHSDLQNDYYQN